MQGWRPLAAPARRAARERVRGAGARAPTAITQDRRGRRGAAAPEFRGGRSADPARFLSYCGGGPAPVGHTSRGASRRGAPALSR